MMNEGEDCESFREEEAEETLKDCPEVIKGWWKNVLRSPKFIVAPMVDASELPWRLLSRRYNAQLCFTPMFHSRIFVEDSRYRTENLYTSVCSEDRPLIVQFCGNDPDIFVKASLLAKAYCDGIDINLGCPQSIAKRGHYGAFLEDEWNLIHDIVKKIIEEVQVPVSCKIRVFTDVDKTVRYAKMLESAGCYMLTVHGRTKEQKGPLTGLASWAHIKAVREVVKIPLVANGNIQYLMDVERCIKETGVNGVMSAEGNLHNPSLFSGLSPPCWDLGLEYIELAKQYPCPLSYSRGHLFKLYHHLLMMPENDDLRRELAKGGTLDSFQLVTLKIKERYEKYSSGDVQWVPTSEELEKLPFPPYICQPYERPAVDAEPIVKPPLQSRIEIEIEAAKIGVSKKQMKKMSRNPHKKWGNPRVQIPLCSNCANPTGLKCCYNQCKKCCRTKCFGENLDCEGHKIFIKSNRQKAKDKERGIFNN